MKSDYEYTGPEENGHSRNRFRRESNIKTDLEEFGWEGMAWTHLVHRSNKWQAVKNMVINL
jgi:hypothetical protein